jgi:hypothetical protein
MQCASGDAACAPVSEVFDHRCPNCLLIRYADLARTISVKKLDIAQPVRLGSGSVLYEGRHLVSCLERGRALKTALPPYSLIATNPANKSRRQLIPKPILDDNNLQEKALLPQE